MGETNRTSMVPVSFSLTMATEVISTHTRSIIIAITPGTKLGAPFSCGLYIIRTSGIMEYVGLASGFFCLIKD